MFSPVGKFNSDLRLLSNKSCQIWAFSLFNAEGVANVREHLIKFHQAISTDLKRAVQLQGFRNISKKQKLYTVKLF